MHREQNKCPLCRARLVEALRAGSAVEPDFSGFRSHLRSARLNLLPQILFGAVTDAFRNVKHHVKDHVRDPVTDPTKRATRRKP